MLIQWRLFLACLLTTAVFTLDHEAEKKTSLIETCEQESQTTNENCKAIKEISPLIFENELIALIECVRQTLLNGFPPLIPTFDPFKFPLIPLPLRTEYFSSLMLLTKFQLAGLAGFDITRVSLDLGILPPGITLQIGLKFNKVEVASNYWGKMNLFQMIDVFGRGHFSILLEDTEINLRVVIGVPVQITQFSLLLSLPSTTANITGLFRDEYMSNIISKQLSDTLTTLAEEEEQRINNSINSFIWAAIIPKINEFIKSLSLEDIIAIISGGGGSCGTAVFSIVQEVNSTLADFMNRYSYPIPLEDYEKYIKKAWPKDDLKNDM